MATTLSPAGAGGAQLPRGVAPTVPAARHKDAYSLPLRGQGAGCQRTASSSRGPALLRYPAFLIQKTGPTDGQERLGEWPGSKPRGERQGFPRKGPSRPSPCWTVQKRQGLHPSRPPGADSFCSGWSHPSLMDSLHFPFSSKSAFSHFLLSKV